jgi:hypothetical protein
MPKGILPFLTMNKADSFAFSVLSFGHRSRGVKVGSAAPPDSEPGENPRWEGGSDSSEQQDSSKP